MGVLCVLIGALYVFGVSLLRTWGIIQQQICKIKKLRRFCAGEDICALTAGWEGGTSLALNCSSLRNKHRANAIPLAGNDLEHVFSCESGVRAESCRLVALCMHERRRCARFGEPRDLPHQRNGIVLRSSSHHQESGCGPECWLPW